MGWDPFGGLKHMVHEVGKGISHVASGGLINDVAHATLPPKTARTVDEAVHTANDAQVKVLKDAGNAIKDTALHCVHHPAACAADGADLLPFVGSAVRCTQWAVQAAQHHVGGDTPTNCLGNLASDVLPLGIGKFAKLSKGLTKGAQGLTKGAQGAKFGAKTAKEAEELEKARRKAAELIRQRKKAKLKNELKQTAKDATTEVITTGAITAALLQAMNPPPEDYEPPAEEEEFDEKSAEQPPPPNTMAVAVGAIAFVAIVWLAYDKI